MIGKLIVLLFVGAVGIASIVPASAAVCVGAWGYVQPCRAYAPPPVGWWWGRVWYPGPWHAWNGHPWLYQPPPRGWSWREHEAWEHAHGER